MRTQISRRTKVILGLVVGTYLALMLTKRFIPTTGAGLNLVLWLQEIGLDVAALYFLARSTTTNESPPLIDKLGNRLLMASLCLTVFSSTLFQVLSRGYGVTLSGAMGTPVELMINIPYLLFFALGLLALGRAQMRSKGGSRATLTLAAVGLFGLTAWMFGPALARTGNPIQNQVIHWMCFALECGVMAVGLLAVFAASSKLRYVSLGYFSIALSGYLFQVTEILPDTGFLDFSVDASWTFGQLLLVAGLTLSAASLHSNGGQREAFIR